MKTEEWFAPSAPLQDKQRRFRRQVTLTANGLLAAAFILLPLADHISDRGLAIYVGVLLVTMAAWAVSVLVVNVRHAIEGRKEVREWKATRDHGGRAAEPDTRS